MGRARDRVRLACLAIYVVVGLYTFGHAAAHHPAPDIVWGDKSRTPQPDMTCIGAMFDAALWPLYWSWELQS